jgi:hypothetical protein
MIFNPDPIVNNFCKIVDCYDAFKPMVELWNTIVDEEGSINDKREDIYWETNLVDFVNRVYSILYAESFQYDELDPTRMSLGQPDLLSTRQLLVNNSIRIDKGKKTK